MRSPGPEGSPRSKSTHGGAVLSKKIIEGGALVKHGNCGTPIGLLCEDPTSGHAINRFDFDRKWTCKRGIWQWTQHAVHALHHPQVVPPRNALPASPDYGWQHPGWIRPSVQWDAAGAPPPVLPAWCAVCRQPLRLDFGRLLLDRDADRREMARVMDGLVRESGDIPF
jgi:hypothetical protein